MRRKAEHLNFRISSDIMEQDLVSYHEKDIV